MKKKPQILFVCTRPRDRKETEQLLEKYQVHFLDIDHNTRFNVFNFDIQEHVEQARKYLKQKGADGITFGSDLGTMVAAVLCKEFDLPGPSIDSAFNCYHKYATREYTKGNISYEAIPLEKLENYTWESPFYLKAPSSAVGVLGFTISSAEDLKRADKLCQAELPLMNKPLIPFFKEHLDLKKYPYACKDIMLKEDLISANQITLEGFVWNSEIHFTIMTDTNNFPNSTLIDNFSLPTRLSEPIQRKIKQQAIQDITQVGLDNCFFNVEYFYEKNAIFLIEINSRAAFCFHNLYQKIYKYNVYEAALDLCLGRSPVLPSSSKNWGGQFNVITQDEGTSSSMYNYDLENPELSSLFVQRNTPIRQLSKFGVVIAQLEIFGDSYEEIKTKADKQRALLLNKRPHKALKKTTSEKASSIVLPASQ